MPLKLSLVLLSSLLWLERYAGSGSNRWKSLPDSSAPIFELADQAEVVEDPERAAGGGDDDVVVADRDVEDWGDRQVQLERVPLLAAVG